MQTTVLKEHKGKTAIKRAHSPSKKGGRSVLLRSLTLPAAVLVLWELLSKTGILSVQLFSSPTLIVTQAVELTVSGRLWTHLEISLVRAFLGFLLGGSLGLLAGTLTGMYRTAEEYLNPSLQMLRTVPLLAITPLFILWFGFGELSKVLLISLGAFFPMYMQTFLGIRNVDNKLYEAARVMEFSRLEQITKVMLPSAMPNILLGIRLSLGVAWMCLVAAELLGADRGIGFMIQDARSFMETDTVFVGIIIFALAGKLSDSFARCLEHRLLDWQDSYKA